MQPLTRRALLEAGLGAALLTVLSTAGSPTAAGASAGAAHRVRLTKGTAYGSLRTTLPATFPTPTPGNALVAVASIDGSAGTFALPAGWRFAFSRGRSPISMVTMYRVATGSESGVTFAWSQGSRGGSWLVAEYGGLSRTDPIGPAWMAPYSNTARRRMAVNPPAAEASSLVLALFSIDAMNPQSAGDTGGVEFRPLAPGWTWVDTSYHGSNGSCPGTALDEYDAPLGPGTDLGPATFTWSRLDQTAAGSLQLNLPAAPRLVSRWVGAVTTTGATVAVKVADGSTARLMVATDPALTSDVSYSAQATADSDGLTKLDIDGLEPATQYYYAVEVEGSLDTERTGSFRTAGSGSFTFGFGSCCGSAVTDTFAEIRSHDPDLFVHLGDLHYGNISTDDVEAFRSRYDIALAAASQGSLYANVPTAYVWSDHDFGANSSNGSSPSRPAAQAAYRQYVPSYPLPSTSGGIYQTFTYGRIRFVLTDNRSYKSPAGTADTASKTILGDEQKAWFKDVIADATEPVIIWGNENPWTGSPTAQTDGWRSYDTERQELVAFIQASGKHVAIISGDMHAVAADDGTNSPGGIPVFHAAPLFGNSHHRGGPYTYGPFPAEGQRAQQYGIMSVQDTGTSIALEFTGYEAGRTARVTYTKTYDV